MRYPVYCLPLDKDLLKQFPSLQKHDAFSKEVPGMNRNLVLRYIFFCYDQSIKWETPEFKERKKQAAELAGFKTMDRHTVQMMNNALEEVNDMIVAFFRLQHYRKYRMKIMALELLDQYHKIIMEPIRKKLDDDKRARAANLKTDLMLKCKTLDELICQIDEEYYGSSEEADEIENIPISPENLSKLTEDV